MPRRDGKLVPPPDKGSPSGKQKFQKRAVLCKLRPCMDQEQWEFLRSEESKGQVRQTLSQLGKSSECLKFSVAPMSCLDLLRDNVYPESRGDTGDTGDSSPDPMAESRSHQDQSCALAQCLALVTAAGDRDRDTLGRGQD